VQVRYLELKQFRCFSQLSLTFNEQMVLICGQNGSGKTSILEALHYLCYLHSFRETSPRHLIHFGQESFFLKVNLEDMFRQDTEIQVGFSAGKRLVKVNKSPVYSYKDLIDYYRVITVTEDDLQLVKGGPERRRSFLDQALILYDPDFIHVLRKYKQILENRNRLLQQPFSDKLSFELWTQQLWEKAKIIQQNRTNVLASLVKHTNQLIQDYFNQELSFDFIYQPKRACDQESIDKFLVANKTIFENEWRYGRSLFGAHLDDFAIEFQQKKSKIYASRGQQKLALLLLKIAQLQELKACKGGGLLLLDDFMNDFDKSRGKLLIEIIAGLNCQAIFASPLQNSFFEQLLLKRGVQNIELKA